MGYQQNNRKGNEVHPQRWIQSHTNQVSALADILGVLKLKGQELTGHDQNGCITQRVVPLQIIVCNKGTSKKLTIKSLYSIPILYRCITVL